MIPSAYITQWASQVPWPTPNQVEQDLLLSRLVIEIANHDLLGSELVFRGGTCLHKLHLPEPLRYSEDLDFCRRTRTPIGEFIDALRQVGSNLGFTATVAQKMRTVTVVLRCAATDGGTIRIKIETNILETIPWRPTIELVHRLESDWWSGEANVPTFELEELFATKLRALHQRRKGRDLFDLWIGLAEMPEESDAVIVDALRHYMGDDMFSYRAFRDTLQQKLLNPEFTGDMSTLTTAIPAGYDSQRAADLVISRLGRFLDGAPHESRA